MPNIKNKTTTQARDAQIIAGITKDLKAVDSLALAGATYTPVTLIALIQSRINAVNSAAAARAAWLAAVKKMEALNTQVDAVEMGLKQYAFNFFGKTAPQLADFGFAAPKRTPRTTEEKQLAVQKGKATRIARGTLSTKAKAKIKGALPSPAQPAAASAPATTPEPTPPTVTQTPAPAAPATPAAPTAPPKS